MDDAAAQKTVAEVPAALINVVRRLGVGWGASGQGLEQSRDGEADENRLLRGHPAVAGSVGAHHIERHGDGDEEAADERGDASGDGQGLVASRRPSLDVSVDAGFDQQPGSPDCADMGEAVPATIAFFHMLG